MRIYIVESAREPNEAWLSSQSMLWFIVSTYHTDLSLTSCIVSQVFNKGSALSLIDVTSYCSFFYVKTSPKRATMPSW